MTPERIAEIRGRAERATAGPWITEFNHQPDGCWITTGAPIGGLVASVFNDDGLLSAEFIAHARQDVPDLLDALTAAQQENARLRAFARDAYSGLIQELEEMEAEAAAAGRQVRDRQLMGDGHFRVHDIKDAREFLKEPTP